MSPSTVTPVRLTASSCTGASHTGSWVSRSIAATCESNGPASDPEPDDGDEDSATASGRGCGRAVGRVVAEPLRVDQDASLRMSRRWPATRKVRSRARRSRAPGRSRCPPRRSSPGRPRRWTSRRRPVGRARTSRSVRRAGRRDATPLGTGAAPHRSRTPCARRRPGTAPTPRSPAPTRRRRGVLAPPRPAPTGRPRPEAGGVDVRRRARGRAKPRHSRGREPKRRQPEGATIGASRIRSTMLIGAR